MSLYSPQSKINTFLNFFPYSLTILLVPNTPALSLSNPIIIFSTPNFFKILTCLLLKLVQEKLDIGCIYSIKFNSVKKVEAFIQSNIPYYKDKGLLFYSLYFILCF